MTKELIQIMKQFNVFFCILVAALLAIGCGSGQGTDPVPVIEGHRYGDTYYLAVLPIDADGAPGNSAALLNYS